MAAGLFGAALALYVATLAPSVVTLFDDSLEFQLVTWQLGIAHPTGYPLYTLLGKLFTFIPVGNIAYRVNLMSAVFAAAAIALVYLLIMQMAPARKHSANRPLIWPTRAGAMFGTMLLATGVVFWQQATIAEVYALNAFFVAALLLLVIRLAAKENSRAVYWIALLAGLSLTHHRTMVLLLPAVAIYLYLMYGQRLFTPKTLSAGALFFLLPLLLYLYLPLRGHVGSLDGTYQNNWAGFWRQISAGGYGASFLLDNPFGHDRDTLFYWRLLSEQFYVTVPGLIGLVYLFQLGHRRYLVLTGIAFLTYFLFNIFYNVTDIDVFFIPIFLIWAVWSGIGAAFLLRTAATLKISTADRRPPTAEKPLEKHTPLNAILVAVTLAIFGFILLQLFQSGYETLRVRYTWQVHDYGLDMLAQPPAAEDSVIVGILGEMTLLRYFQQTEARRPDIETITADLESDRLAAVERLLAEGKSVYLTRPLPGAAERGSLNAAGPLIRVDSEPKTRLPETIIPVNRPVTPEIELAGYTVSRPPHTGEGRGPIRLTLYWRVEQPAPTDLKVSARLVDSTGTEQASVDAVPVHFAYPTTAWRPGEMVSDVYDLTLPIDVPPGQYTPRIIWYNPAQNAAEVGRIELQPVRVE